MNFLTLTMPHDDEFHGFNYVLLNTSCFILQDSHKTHEHPKVPALLEL